MFCKPIAQKTEAEVFTLVVFAESALNGVKVSALPHRHLKDHLCSEALLLLRGNPRIQHNIVFITPTLEVPVEFRTPPSSVPGAAG